MAKYLDKYVKDFKTLCSPAFIYLLVSVLIFIVVALQNFGNTTKYCLGEFKCNVPITFMIFDMHAIYRALVESWRKLTCLSV